MRPLVEAEEGRAGGVHGRESRGDVEPAGSDLVRRRPWKYLRRRHQGVLEATRGPGGMCGGQDGRSPGDVRRGHRGAVHRLVHALAELQQLRPRRRDLDAGRRDVGLERVVAASRAHAREPRPLVETVDRGHRERLVRGAWSTDCELRAAVPRGDHEQHALVAGQLVDRLRQRVEPVGQGGIAQAHADDLGPVGSPLHAVDDPRVLPEAVVAEHLADDEVGARGDALVEPRRRGARAGDGRGDVGAVAVAVTDVLAWDERLRLGDVAGEVGVGRVDTGVEHGDGRARSVEPGRPRLRSADLRNAVGEVGLDLAVQPELRDSAREARRERLRRAARSGDRGPEEIPLPTARGDRGAVDAGQVALLRRAGRRRALCGCLVGRVLRDQRQEVGALVVVALLDQPRDVQQLAVEPAGCEVGQRLLRQDVQVFADRQRPDAAVGARRLLERRRRPPSGLGDPDDVTGDQGDHVGRRRGLRLGTALPGIPAGRRERGRQQEGNERSAEDEHAR